MIRALLCLLLALCAARAQAAPEARSRTIVEADGSRTLVVEVEIKAPAADVWKAISTPEGWQGWAVPLARTVEGEPDMIETSYDPAAPPGGPGTIRQLFLARIPGRLLAFRTVKAPAGFPDFDTYGRVVSVFELEPRGDRTTFVRLSAHPYPDTEAGRRLIGFFERGNRASLDMLRRRFAEGPADWSKERLSK
ncbi:MAG TPA: SRPBCC domain-containing protein [Allosphingosinicella sp.]